MHMEKTPVRSRAYGIMTTPQAAKNYTLNVKCVHEKRAILDENMSTFLDLPASHEYPLFTLLYRRYVPSPRDCTAGLRMGTGCSRWC